MKKNEKDLNLKGKRNSLIRTCPVCGFSFRTIDSKTKRKVTVCPMCGHKFKEPDIFPFDNDRLNKRFF
ncbi:MAG: hypothetical protein ACFFBZ_04285 [Promethearchaeota archaeon]